jgi:non-ribosomal peptide synthetase component F
VPLERAARKYQRAPSLKVINVIHNTVRITRAKLVNLGLSSAQLQQLLGQWNSTQAEYPTHHCIHQLIESQVECTPDQVAIVFENHSLTYRELNCRARPDTPFIESQTQPQQIFLTGASGFLGAFLLHELLQQTQAIAIAKAIRTNVPKLIFNPSF